MKTYEFNYTRVLVSSSQNQPPVRYRLGLGYYSMGMRFLLGSLGQGPVKARLQ